MKLALVISSFAESSLSLARALAENGHFVDVYICIYNKYQKELPGINFITEKRKFGKIYEINYNSSIGVRWCEKCTNAHVYIAQMYPTGQNSYGVKKKIAQSLFNYSLRHLCRRLRKLNYNAIDIITQHPAYNYMSSLLYGQKIIRSYHEVLKDHMKEHGLHPCLEFALKQGEHVRIFSEKAYSDVNKHTNVPISKEQISIIPFGLFDNYLEYPNTEISCLNKWDNYILFIGSIQPYKGLSIMYEAIQNLKNKGYNLKIVVAGNGYDKCIERIKNDSSYILINRFLTNMEIVSLIRNSIFVVCPYLSVSQSGIPQTAFVFNKPVIASRIGSFPQIIKSDMFGILVEPENVKSLSLAIEKLYTDNVLLDNCKNNINNFQQLNMEFSWRNIVNEYINMVNKL